MFIDRTQSRWCQHSIFCIIALAITIACMGTFTACASQPPPDRPLTHNGTISDDEVPATIITSRSKTIKPIEIVSGQSNLISYANGKMSLTVTTSPYAICNFIVSYGMSEPSKSFGIKPMTADTHGVASWQWQVEGKAPTGTWPLKITATLANGAQTTRNINITVTLPPVYLDSAKSVLSVVRKAEATLAIVTAPSVGCTMTMSYVGKTRTFKGTTDAKGEISWTWRVEAEANPGSYPLIVTITTGSGEQTRGIFPLTIK
jgi:hypothetical protein